MGMMRKLMRNVRRKMGSRTMGTAPAVGAVRAGMHQAAEHEFRRSRMAADADPVEETAENALDMPAAVEAEIPPVEEEDDEEVAAVAEDEEVIAPDDEILEEIADPQAEIEEEKSGQWSVVSDQMSDVRDQGSVVSDQRDTMAVDWSAERIPVLDYIVSGSSDPSTPLEYSSQDGSLKEIQEPLPGMAEAYGVAPYIPGVEDPSANVADYEAPEPEPEPEPDPEPDPETPDDGGGGE